MRIAIAGFSQETNTFNPIPSTLADFENHTLLFGEQLLERLPDRDTLSGILDFYTQQQEVEVVPVLWAECVANGKLSDETLYYFENQLVERLGGSLPIDALLFALHGATVSRSIDDVSGYLLRAARKSVGRDTPVAVALDHHAVVTEQIVRFADIVDAHETQPHDCYHTGRKAARSLLRVLTAGVRPVKCFVKIPMIAPQDQFLTSGGPMKQWFDHARELEKNPEVLSVSLFPMQPWVDVVEGGWAVVAFTDDNPELASSIVVSLAKEAWSLREAFWVSERLSIEKGIRKAARQSGGLVVLSDTGDAVYGGSTGDSTCILKELIRQDIPCPAYVPIVDAAAVEEATRKGIGTAVLTVGAVYDPFSTPAKLHGTIRAISCGLRCATHQGWGIITLGRTVLMQIKNVFLVILEKRNHAINMPLLYTHLGLDMADAGMVVCKTGSNFQYFDSLRGSLIRLDTPGASQANLAGLEWKRLPRPVYPFDDLLSWEPVPVIL